MTFLVGNEFSSVYLDWYYPCIVLVKIEKVILNLFLFWDSKEYTEREYYLLFSPHIQYAGGM